PRYRNCTTEEKKMDSVTVVTSNTLAAHLQARTQTVPGTKNCYHLLSHHQRNNFSTKLQSFGVVVKSFASRKSVKKSKKDGKLCTSRTKKVEDSAVVDKSSARDDLLVGQSNGVSLNDNLVGENLISSTPREVVLQACTVTSGLILALGLVIRQVSHIAFVEGLPVVDSSSEVSFMFEMWHLKVIIGLVILISSSRYLLLQMWPHFAESSEAANQQVLSSLQPLDYMVVAFLPGFSEELLFRGALLPLFGLNWKSVLVVAVIFGALHLGSGRKYSFAVW
ncbi:hypothetical protein IFM89_004632, partial [Coptis chinensis]